jgi:hypothetical protein
MNGNPKTKNLKQNWSNLPPKKLRTYALENTCGILHLGEKLLNIIIRKLPVHKTGVHNNRWPFPKASSARWLIAFGPEKSNQPN